MPQATQREPKPATGAERVYPFNQREGDTLTGNSTEKTRAYGNWKLHI